MIITIFCKLFGVLPLTIVLDKNGRQCFSRMSKTYTIFTLLFFISANIYYCIKLNHSKHLTLIIYLIIKRKVFNIFVDTIVIPTMTVVCILVGVKNYHLYYETSMIIDRTYRQLYLTTRYNLIGLLFLIYMIFWLSVNLFEFCLIRKDFISLLKLFSTRLEQTVMITIAFNCLNICEKLYKSFSKVNSKVNLFIFHASRNFSHCSFTEGIYNLKLNLRA